MKISDNVKNKLYEAGLVPVIKPVAGTDGAALADALYRGGVYAAEVTFRAAGAAELIAAMRKARPELTVGAGTVLTEDQSDEAVEAGAQFCVAPGFNQRVAAHCISLGVPFVPGVSSATQIEAAMEAGLDFVKFFPAEQSGGLAAIKALSAPYRDMSFMPTGGINEENLNGYLAFKKVVCCGGSWLTPETLMKNGDYAGITALCEKATRKMLGYSVAHIGINCAGDKEAFAGAELLKKAFGFEPRETPVSVFAEDKAELMKNGGRGRCGHVAIGTTNAERAMARIREAGFTFDESSFKRDESGHIYFAYLNEEICGFAWHLIENK